VVYQLEKPDISTYNGFYAVCNPPIGFVRLLMRLALHLQRRTHALIGQIMATIKR